MFIVIIPARYASTRFPGKPLADIYGKPMIVRVMEQSMKSNANKVIVATDHKDIADVVKKSGGEICMTSSNHASGIERISEVINIYNIQDNEIIVNVQGDEPLTPPEVINKIVYNFIKKKTNVVTLATPIKKIQEIFNPNIVKVVTNKEGVALYFSRSPIPWSKNYSNIKFVNINSNLLRHIGIYAYKASFIRNYVKLKTSPLENIEMLEQIRILWYGYKIFVKIINYQNYHSVDTLEDLNFIRKKIKLKNK